MSIEHDLLPSIESNNISGGDYKNKMADLAKKLDEMVAEGLINDSQAIDIFENR